MSYLAASEDKSLKDCDVLVVTVLTHGDENGCLYSRDGKYKTSDVWGAFRDNKHLLGKPKIFIFQVCCIVFIKIGI